MKVGVRVKVRVCVPMVTTRRWSSSEKRMVGSRQSWRCACCALLLPGTFEVDHVTPLHIGGLDCIESNAEALCNQYKRNDPLLRELFGMGTET